MILCSFSHKNCRQVMKEWSSSFLLWKYNQWCVICRDEWACLCKKNCITSHFITGHTSDSCFQKVHQCLQSCEKAPAAVWHISSAWYDGIRLPHTSHLNEKERIKHHSADYSFCLYLTFVVTDRNVASLKNNKSCMIFNKWTHYQMSCYLQLKIQIPFSASNYSYML